MHGWAGYFKRAVAKDLFSALDNFAWSRVAAMARYRHRWRWADVKHWLRRPDGSWRRPYVRTRSSCIASARSRSPATGGALRTSRTRTCPRHRPDGRTVESPVRCKPHAGFGERPGKTDRQRCQHRAPDRLSIIGRGLRSAVGTLVDRATRFVHLIHLPGGWKAPQLRDALAARFGSCPGACRAL